MRRALILAALLVAAVAWAQYDTDYRPSNNCPLHPATAGVPIPDRSQLADCQCEKWWNGQAPARLVFADCSHRSCAMRGPTEDAPLVYVDLALYRCPKCGLLFTEPGE